MPQVSPHTPASADTAAPPLASAFAQIRTLVPLHRLDDDAFLDVMAYADTQALPRGAVVFRRGADEDYMFYLIEGALDIHDDKNESFQIHSGTVEAMHPLSVHPTARSLALAASDVVVVRLPVEVLHASRAPSTPGGCELEEIAEDDAAADRRILFDVYHDLMEGRFALPTLPDLAVQIRTTVSDPNKSVDDIVRIVQRDPGVAAYCVRVANSAAIASVRPISEVREAVIRLGSNTIRDLVTAYTLRELYKAPDAATRTLMRNAWQHSARIGALSYVIADRSGDLNPERALLAGLLHDIGILIVIREWRAHCETPLEAATLCQLGRDLNGSLGSMVLRNWQFADNIIEVAMEPENWQRHASRKLDLCDVVALAHAHDQHPPPWSYTPPAIDTIAAYQRLANGKLSASGQLLLLETAADELRSIDAMLRV